MFRSWDVDQGWLLPPLLHEFVLPGHMALFVRDTVREALDLSAILDTYAREHGYTPYPPGMKVALLLLWRSEPLRVPAWCGRGPKAGQMRCTAVWFMLVRRASVRPAWVDGGSNAGGDVIRRLAPREGEPMASALSADLRECVVVAIEAGASRREAAVLGQPASAVRRRAVQDGGI